MPVEGRKRVVIEKIKPEIDDGRFPIKRVVGEKVVVTADIFADGHDAVWANVLYKYQNDNRWRETPMLVLENDRWQGEFIVEETGIYAYTVEGGVDHFKTWQKDLKKKYDARQDIKVEILIGIQHIQNILQRVSGDDKKNLLQYIDSLRDEEDRQEAVKIVLSEELSNLIKKYPDKQSATKYEKDLSVIVDRPKALFSAWYERFPRSCSPQSGEHGTFKDCEAILPEIAKMGFDVFYLPPIHPIGKRNRKGKNNSPVSVHDDVGCPWAIGSHEGGHKSIHPQLGTLSEFTQLMNKAKDYGIEIALDLAFQCSPDHPYVKQHPEWFRWRPDGSVQYAENPPKKYEDVLP